MSCVEVEPIAAPAPSNVEQWDKVGYTKLQIWGLEQCVAPFRLLFFSPSSCAPLPRRFDRVLYIDADCLVRESLEAS